MTTKKKLIIGVVIAAFLIVVAGATYYHFVQKPLNLRVDKYYDGARYELQLEREREGKLDECLAEAEWAYRTRWKKSCKSLSRKIDEEGSCTLPSSQSGRYGEDYKQHRSECYQRYLE